MAYIRYKPRTVVINVLLSFNFAVVFNFYVFPIPPSKPQFLGDVSMNVRPCYKYFMFFCFSNGGKLEGDGDDSQRQEAVCFTKEKKNMRLAAVFCLFMRTSPINFGFLGGSGNTLK